MNLAIFGGTFDPIHKGHIRVVRAVGRAMRMDRIFVMPAGDPPHKSGLHITGAEDRLEMCRRAFTGFPKVTVSDWEINREGKSYSYNTIKAFHSLYPNDRLFFIMGSDMYLTLEKWHKIGEILKMCIPVCLTRTGDDLKALNDKASEVGGALFVKVKPIVISSTEIRQMVAEERWDDAAQYVNKDVLDYIRERGLYRSEPSAE
ncbi:MAG: nicotinate-nucleotide adenylyltransferase [Ruminococcus sp.]|nr:nicotinate-nucleotide adenylyltransferase [Ruminococcus sp.]